MGRTLSLLAHLPRLEADGVTHRRDCECVRCDAGFRPSEQERADARERWALRKARDAAARALVRRRERARVKQAALEIQLDAEGRVVDAHLNALYAARARADADARLAMLERLRREGVPLAQALERVEQSVAANDAHPAPKPTERSSSLSLWAQQGSNLRPTD